MDKPDGKSWFKVEVSGEAAGAEGLKIIEQMGQRIETWAQLGAYGRNAVAVFQTLGVRDESTIYFSPPAALLLADLVLASGGQRCPKPSPDGLGLLAGPDGARGFMLGEELDDAG